MEGLRGRSPLRSALALLEVTLTSWTPEHLRDAAEECMRRAAALRGELGREASAELRAAGMRRVEELEGAAAQCELSASALEVP